MSLEPARMDPVDGRSDLIAVAVLTLIWCLPVAFIGVSGDFPLNDDWAYARAAQRLIETGLVERVAWTWVPAITHSGLGALFATLLDLPWFESLRWVGIAGGWAGMIGSYALCRTVGAGPLASALGAAVVGLNPVYLNLSFTYMTDVPFAATCTWSLVALCIGVKRRSWIAITIGILLALSAMLTRQTGMALPIAFVAAVLISAPTDERSWLAAALTSALLFSGFQLAMANAYGPGDAAMYFAVDAISIAVNQGHVLFHLIANGAAMLSYLGCFVAPLVFLVAFRKRSRFRPLAIATAVFTPLCLLLVARLGLPMPPGINMIYNLGLGRRMLSTPQVVPVMDDSIWWVLTGLGFAFAFVGIVEMALGALPRIWELRRRPEILVCLAFPVGFIAPHLLRAPCFDRYLIPVLAPIVAMLLVLPNWSRIVGRARLGGSIAALLVLATFGTLGTRDYMQHHRTRFALLDDLMQQGISSDRIHGGFEFNGWHSMRRFEGGEFGSYWRHINSDEYILTDVPERRGFTLVAAGSFDRLMPPGVETLQVMHRDGSSVPAGERTPLGPIPDERPRPEKLFRASSLPDESADESN